MPQAVLRSSHDIAIVLDRLTAFMSGDTVSGHVVRKAHLVDGKAKVVVRLFGRAKILIRVNHGMSSSVHRIRFNFFPVNTAQTIYHGPIHIPPDGSTPGEWPFAMTLPNRPDLVSLKRDDPGAKTFVPLDQVAAQPLPASFCSRGGSPQAYVEYYLEATLQGSGSNNRQPSQAIFPITVRPVSSPNLIADYALKKYSGGSRHTVVSQRLVPGMENVKLSFGQKAKKTLLFSQVPAFAFSVELEVPSLLQIGHADTIPFGVRVNPLWNQTSEILQNTSQMITIKHFTLKLQATTCYTSKVLGSDGLDHKTSVTLRAYNRRPAQMPATPAGSGAAVNSGDTKVGEAGADQTPPDADTLIVPIASGSQTLDIGKALGIKVKARGCKVAASFGDDDIYPTFTTCNIKHEHHLKWQLALSIAEETVKCEGKRPVKLLGPSHDQVVQG